MPPPTEVTEGPLALRRAKVRIARVKRSLFAFKEVPVPAGSRADRIVAYGLRAICWSVAAIFSYPVFTMLLGALSLLLLFVFGGVAAVLFAIGLGVARGNPVSGFATLGPVWEVLGMIGGFLLVAVAVLLVLLLIGAAIITPVNKTYLAWVERRDGRVWKVQTLSAVALFAGIGGLAAWVYFQAAGGDIASVLSNVSLSPSLLLPVGLLVLCVVGGLLVFLAPRGGARTRVTFEIPNRGDPS